jgi:hypothetical protein
VGLPVIQASFKKQSVKEKITMIFIKDQLKPNTDIDATALFEKLAVEIYRWQRMC